MENVKSGMNVLAFLARAFAMPAELFLRRSGTFGHRYFGFQAVAGLFVIPLWSVLWPDRHPFWLNRFMLLVLGMLLIVRMRTTVRGERSCNFHSRYAGLPRLTRLFGEDRERIIKCGIEPMTTLIAGSLLCAVDEPLGSFIMASALGLYISANLVEASIQTRVADLNDAMLEQREVLDRWRTTQRDRHH
jgi:hypothetical protein